jgi:hypothetical protein
MENNKTVREEMTKKKAEDEHTKSKTGAECKDLNCTKVNWQP